MNDLEAAMGDISFRHTKSLIDEIPMAYKDIDEVIENSKELVQVDHTLKQIVNIKGDKET
jgi:tRNA-splicing ligase RtcB